MKVAFWSNVNGKCSTSSNAAALSIMSTLECNRKIALFENNIGISGLENAFVNKKSIMGVNEAPYGYNNIGMEPLIKKLHTDFTDINSISNNAMRFLDDRLFYLPWDNIENKDIYEYELNMVIDSLIEKLEAFAGNVFIDISGSNNLSTKSILNDVDIVVVNINQNHAIIKDFFDNYQSIADKAFFVLGNYEQYSRLDMNAISRYYKINPNRIGAVPYNYEYREALNNGKVIDFISKYYNCRKRDSNYHFISQIKRSSLLLNEMMSGKDGGGRL